MSFIKFTNVSFTWPSMTAPLLDNVNIHFDQGWTGITGANGTGKTTLLRLASGELEPTYGHISGVGYAVYVPQRTDDAPDDFEDILTSEDRDTFAMRTRLKLRADWLDRWDTLSHGERKRVQIASALLKYPDLLALDEPTNHIDHDARLLLIEALRAFRGTGLLVSHDRELMDSLCRQCLFIIPPRAIMRAGTLTQGLAQDRLEVDTARRRDNEAKAKVARIRSDIQERRETSDKAVASAAKAAKGKHDHDSRAKRNLAKMTSKDSWATKQISQMNTRAKRAASERAGLQIRKEYDTGFWLEGADCSRRNFVLAVDAGTIPVGENRTLSFPELRIAPTDRVSLTGPNGAGKSTLLNFLLDKINLEPERICYIPQEISAEKAREIKTSVAELDREKLGFVMKSVSRLGTRPGRLLESELPSPGETRKILLAESVRRGPHIVIMDEPTNHLDVTGIECMEEALAEAPCALLLISHDNTFLEKLTTTHWHIFTDADGNGTLEIVRELV